MKQTMRLKLDSICVNYRTKETFTLKAGTEVEEQTTMENGYRGVSVDLPLGKVGFVTHTNNLEIT